MGEGGRGRAFIELVGLAGLAITAPVLDVFGRAPDVFLHRQAGRVAIVAFALLVALLPAAALWGLEQLVGLAGDRPRRLAHLGALGLLFLLLALRPLSYVVPALALAVAGVLAYRRWLGVRRWLAYLAAAPVVFVALFLTTSDVADLLADQDVAAADIGPVGRPASVVVLQFDEWPLSTIVDGDGHIDPELYPNLAALADDGVWYRNATTAATYTTYAVPAILTGRQPEGERSPVASEYPENLFTLLAGRFDLDVIEAVTQLCPPNLCDRQLVDQGDAGDALERPHGLGRLLIDAAQTFQAMVSPDPDALPPAATLRDAVVVADGPEPGEAADDARRTDSGSFIAPPVYSLDTVDALVGSIEDGEPPTVHFLHLLLPHTPYVFLPDGRRYAQGSGGLTAPLPQVAAQRPDEPAAAAFDEQRLLLQASYADTVVGRVVDRLRDAGLYDDAVVAVVADHGIGLQPGGPIRAPEGDRLPRDVWPDLLYVPMVVKAPGLPAGTVSDANAETIDLVPTIAGALGVDLPWSVDGIDLGAETRSSSGKETHVVEIADGLHLGPSLHFDGEEVQPEVLDRNVDTLLRDDNPEHRLYDVDDAGELVGSPLTASTAAPATGATAVLDDVGPYLDVDLASGFLPAHLVADVSTSDPDEITVAVALNGTIAAVGQTWAGHHFEAMLLPDAFVDGPNDVRLFLVGGTEGARTLSPVTYA